MSEIKFGLKEKKKTETKVIASVFGEDSDEEVVNNDNKTIPYSTHKVQNLRNIEKLYNEDKTIFQYDEIHEQITTSNIIPELKAIKRKFNLSEKFEKSAHERNLRLQLTKAKKNRDEIPDDKRQAYVSQSYAAQLQEQTEFEKLEKARENDQEENDVTSLGKLMLQKNLKDYSHIRAQRCSDEEESDEEIIRPNLNENNDLNENKELQSNVEIKNLSEPVGNTEIIQKREQTPEFIREAKYAQELREKAREKLSKPDYSKDLKAHPRTTTDEMISEFKKRYLLRKHKRLAVIEDDSD